MTQNSVFNKAVLVGALGYFVDIYDLLLFSIVRVPSLRDLGVGEAEILNQGVLLLNIQMIGLLVGGLVWGIWGDKRGRVSVLFGSILLYSLANIANGFVHSITMYAILRFVAGVGLAGELGAAITLVSEVMTKERRGYGTALVASVGILGAVLAALIGDYFDWRVAFVVGGALGLCLLVLRVRMLESGLFANMRSVAVSRGNFFSLFHNRERALKYINCILIGVPIWYVVGVLMTFSPELAQALQVDGVIKGGSSVMFAYIGTSAGDLLAGVVSQLLHSRKKAIAIFMATTFALILVYLFSHGLSVFLFYALCVAIGFGSGYWAVFVTNASEQFGTNLRATVATTTPNFVRGAVVPLTMAVQFLKGPVGLVSAALVVGVVTFAIAALALFLLPEPFGKDLNYYEV